jgi:spore maturation protein CgeB
MNELKGPQLSKPSLVQQAYKKVFGRYEYENRIFKMFENGFNAGLELNDSASDYPDY